MDDTEINALDPEAFERMLHDRWAVNRESRTLMSSWRLARAPMQAKLIKFADIIDNATSIREHDRGFFRLWAAEKVDILKRMLEIEGSGLSENALFERAWAQRECDREKAEQVFPSG